MCVFFGCVYEDISCVCFSLYVCVRLLSFLHEHAVISHCLLCLLVTVTPGYFCCRGIYTSSLSLTPFLHLFSRPHFHPAVCLHLHLKPQLSSCVSIYVCVLFITVVRSVCIGIDVSLVCVSHVCVMLSSLTKQKQDLAKPWS